MFNKIVAISSLALLAGFLAILGIWVESTALRIVLVVTVLMAAYDFWRSEVRTRSDKSD